MTQSVLGHLTLGYRLGWNRWREVALVELFVDGGQEERVDAAHLLRTLRELWAGTSPDLLLTLPSPTLLADLLASADADAPWIEIHPVQLQDAAMAEAVLAAASRGVRLIWRGPSDQPPQGELARAFRYGLFTLSVDDAVAALRAGPDPRSPLAPGQLYENVPSQVILHQCLDVRHAHAVIDWPVDDVLHHLNTPHLTPGELGIRKLLTAVERDASMEVLENVLEQDPVLAFRFMQTFSTAAMGLRDGVDSLRHGLMMLGYGGLERWLAEQRPHAHREANLQPALAATVLRARLMAQMVHAGVDAELAREALLCGLFSSLDTLLRQPLRQLLATVHLPERIAACLTDHTGPYAPYLDIARALEQPDTFSTRLLCEEHGLSLEDINRDLLRVLSQIDVPLSRGRLG